MRKIAIVTGTRAEYGLLKPLIDGISADPELELQLIVTGMHLSPDYGYTVRQIEADGAPIAARVEMLLASDSMAGMGKAVGIGVYGMTQEFERLRPDMVVILGDRIEAYAGANAALFCGCVIAHIHGGEITRGGLDEYMRHAITKLSHVHFAATGSSRQRIINMGEAPEFVFESGAPGLDALLAFKQMSVVELNDELNITLPQRYALLVQHPVSTHPETAVDEIEASLKALRDHEITTVLVYPNADAGSREMIKVIERYEAHNWLIAFKNLPRVFYTNLLRHAALLVGNSSSGMLDAPSFGIPVVNIGERQEGRDRGGNVIDSPPEHEAIHKAIHHCLYDNHFIETCRQSENPYGDGKACPRILSTLKTIDLSLPKTKKRLPW